MNSIFVIKPYKWEGMWVFDDPNVGLVKEPFVGGADTMIDVATAALPNASKGFIAVFSAGYFPDAEIVLEWVRESGGGNVYNWAEKEMDGWLCPPYSSTSIKRRRSCTSRSRRLTDSGEG